MGEAFYHLNIMVPNQVRNCVKFIQTFLVILNLESVVVRRSNMFSAGIKDITNRLLLLLKEKNR